MINVVDKYFSFNRTLLLVIGLWPYEKSKLSGFQIICIFSILVTCIIFQFTTILSSKCSAEFIIKILSSIFAFTSFVIKYNSFYVNSETIKCLMEQLQHTYNNIRDNNEIAIVEEYGSKAKHYTTILTTAVLSVISVVMGAQLWPDFIDIIIPTNVSRSHHLQISTEYFIDQERYFYLLLLHINTAIFIGSFILTVTGTMLVACLHHACGMFKIASYRIEKAIQIYVLKNINYRNEVLVHKGIIRAVDIHRKALIFSTYLISRFEISFMLLIAVGVLTLSLNIFRLINFVPKFCHKLYVYPRTDLNSTFVYQIFQIVLFGYDAEELLINLAIAFMCSLYMFIANFIGQQIIDHNNHVFFMAYKVHWYVTPLHIQKLILFLLLRGNKNFGLRVGGLFIASLQCFATLTNASVSYFTIMYSMQ